MYNYKSSVSTLTQRTPGHLTRGCHRPPCSAVGRTRTRLCICRRARRSYIQPDGRGAEWRWCNLAKAEARWPSAPGSHFLFSLEMTLSTQKIQTAASVSLFSCYHTPHSFVCHLISSLCWHSIYCQNTQHSEVGELQVRAVSSCLDTEVTMVCQINRQSHLCDSAPGGGKLYTQAAPVPAFPTILSSQVSVWWEWSVLNE